jgi:hypothetical protein
MCIEKTSADNIMIYNSGESWFGVQERKPRPIHSPQNYEFLTVGDEFKYLPIPFKYRLSCPLHGCLYFKLIALTESRSECWSGPNGHASIWVRIIFLLLESEIDGVSSGWWRILRPGFWVESLAYDGTLVAFQASHFGFLISWSSSCLLSRCLVGSQ